MKRNLAIKYFPIDELKVYERNSRTHTDKQIKQIADSIKEYEFTNPILIDENNTIVAGHARLEAAKQIGVKTVPCIVIPDLTEAQKKAYIIADNKLALNADWDINVLQIEMSELNKIDYNLDLIGFDKSELDKIMNGEILDELDAEDDIDPCRRRVL